MDYLRSPGRGVIKGVDVRWQFRRRRGAALHVGHDHRQLVLLPPLVPPEGAAQCVATLAGAVGQPHLCMQEQQQEQEQQMYIVDRIEPTRSLLILILGNSTRNLKFEISGCIYIYTGRSQLYAVCTRFQVTLWHLGEFDWCRNHSNPPVVL